MHELRELGLDMQESALLTDENGVLNIIRTPGAASAPRPASATATYREKPPPATAAEAERLVFKKMLIKLQVYATLAIGAQC